MNQIQRQYYSLEAGSERENSYKYGSDLPDEPKAYSYLMMGTRALGDKVYERKDHLGNVRVTLSDVRLSTIFNSALTGFRTEVVSMSDYYAFGMLMVGRNWSAGEYRYGFQGQEMDNETQGVGNSINYTYRVHDTRLGRFLSIDPLSPKYPHNSPYSFAENRVVDGIDLEGREWEDAVGRLVRKSLINQELSFTDNFSQGYLAGIFLNALSSNQGRSGSSFKKMVLGKYNEGDYFSSRGAMGEALVANSVFSSTNRVLTGVAYKSPNWGAKWDAQFNTTSP